MARKRPGGRTTPKRTRPRNWSPSGPTAVPPDLAKLLPELFGPEAVIRDYEASNFASLFRPSPTPSTQASTSALPPRIDANAVIDVLSDFISTRDAGVVNGLASLATFAEPAIRQRAGHLLESFGFEVHTAAPGLGRAEIVSAYKAVDSFREVDQYALGLSYPDGEQGIFAIIVDLFEAGIAKDALVFPSVDMFLEAIAEEPGITIESMPIAEAVGWMSGAFDVLLSTPDAESLVDPITFSLLPMFERLAERTPHEVLAAEPVSEAQQNEHRRKFEAWVNAQGTDNSALLERSGHLPFEFMATEGSGHLAVWGPRGTTRFLEWASRVVEAPLDELSALPRLATLLAKWSHDELGWVDEDLDETLAAIRSMTPAFLDTISPALDYDPAQGLPEVSVPLPDPNDSRAENVVMMAMVMSYQLFDGEFAELAARVALDAVKYRPSIFAKGRLDMWASGVVYAAAQLSGIFDDRGPFQMEAEQLSHALPGSAGTITKKASTIRSSVGERIRSMQPRYQYSKTLRGAILLADGFEQYD